MDAPSRTKLPSQVSPQGSSDGSTAVGSGSSRLSRREALHAAVLACCGAAFGRAANAAEAALITKPIPSTGERLPVIGLGTDSFGEAELAAVRAVITRMHELGGTVVDTAASYGDSEALIGDALAATGLRKSMFLATKLTDGGGFFGGIGGDASFERSLKRLRTSRVDLLQVHNLQGVDTLMPLLRQWKSAGRIRYYGVTTSRVSQHDELIDVMRKHPLDFIQVDYSIANRDAERTILPLAAERRMAVLVNLPLIHGRLMRQVAASPLPAFAGEIGVRSWAQLLLKYVVSHPTVTCAIPGTTQAAHLADDQAAGRGILPDAAMRRRMETYWARTFG
ncbi:MAG: aldo/keto reductase [Steroidobacteraceae bacterium]